MNLGIYGINLPFENETQILTDVIRLKTLKIFSIYSPWIQKVEISVNDMKCIRSSFQESVYELPDIFGERQIIYVKKVTPRNKLLGNGYLSPLYDGSVDIYYDAMNMQAQANLLSTVAPTFTFKFDEPNVLYLYNMSSIASDLVIEVALEHADNFASIPFTSYDSFLELAELDIKQFLYGFLKHYSDIQTAFGSFNLKIDDWSNAESERKDLLERWRDNYHLDTEQFIII